MLAGIQTRDSESIALTESRSISRVRRAVRLSALSNQVCPSANEKKCCLEITVIFGRRLSKHYRGKLQTEIEDMNLPNPVIRSQRFPLAVIVGCVSFCSWPRSMKVSGMSCCTVR
jgi:hypothetical protein